VIKEPVNIKQSLVDDVLVDRPFILNDDRKAVLINPQGVNPSAMRFAGRIFTLKEGNTQQCLKVLLHVGLKRFFKGNRGPFQFSGTTAVHIRYTYVSHCRSVSKIFPTNRHKPLRFTDCVILPDAVKFQRNPVLLFPAFTFPNTNALPLLLFFKVFLYLFLCQKYRITVCIKEFERIFHEYDTFNRGFPHIAGLLM